MTGEWMSQSRAREVFGLSASDLQANVARVIDQSGRSDKPSGEPTPSDAADVKCVRHPRVPLTVRLVKNPRGYHLPMRLYKTSELETLSAIKRAEAPPPKAPDKPVKKAAKSRQRRKAPQPAQPICLSKGHSFAPALPGTHQCSACGHVVEVEEI
ncbi:non-ribosomal peptide synthetase [Babesia caballi]|uniref:Non-ribosomal peptide synthetase n=1 Tax=Babesia caballi TaxID=5871 RepID=A0AAV4LY43_BABCB|nr:non-ribosomal peptide synthetase [Babesia caballi]